MALQFLPHLKGDPHYISPELRMCGACPEENCVHPLARFAKAGENSYRPVCRQCDIKNRDYMRNQREASAIQQFETTLKRTNSERRAAGYSYSQVVDELVHAIGGVKQTYKHVGKVMNRALRRGMRKDAPHQDLDRAVSVGRTLLETAATNEKLRKVETEWESLSEEDKQSMLMDLAYEQIITNAEFRKRLVKDIDVRTALEHELKLLVEVPAGNLPEASDQDEEELWED